MGAAWEIYSETIGITRRRTGKADTVGPAIRVPISAAILNLCNTAVPVNGTVRGRCVRRPSISGIRLGVVHQTGITARAIAQGATTSHGWTRNSEAAVGIKSKNILSQRNESENVGITHTIINR